MFPLHDISRIFPSHLTSCQVGINLLGLLLPGKEGLGGEGIRLVPYNELRNTFDIDSLYEKNPPTHLSGESLKNQILVIRVVGEFFSTDQMQICQIHQLKEGWSIDIDIIHIINPNGDPQNRQLYLLLCIEAGNRKLQRMLLQFRSCWHDFQGKEVNEQNPISSTMNIEFND